jgi:hypothetical protein
MYVCFLRVRACVCVFRCVSLCVALCGCFLRVISRAIFDQSPQRPRSVGWSVTSGIVPLPASEVFTDVFSCSSTRCVCCVQVELHGSLTQARVAVRTLARRLWSAPRRWCYHFQGHCHLRREQSRKCHVERGRFSLRATRSRTLSAHRRSILRGPCRDRRGV